MKSSNDIAENQNAENQKVMDAMSTTDCLSDFDSSETNAVVESIDAASIGNKMMPSHDTADPRMNQHRIGSFRGTWIHNTLLLALCSMVIVLSVFMRNDGPKQVFLPFINAPLPELCSFQRLFDRDCPGCGMTRAFINIGHGHFLRAWSFNAAAFVLFPLIAIQIPWRLVQLYRLHNKQPPLEFPYIWVFGLALMVAILIQWSLKLAGYWTVY